MQRAWGLVVGNHTFPPRQCCIAWLRLPWQLSPWDYSLAVKEEQMARFKMQGTPVEPCGRTCVHSSRSFWARSSTLPAVVVTRALHQHHRSQVEKSNSMRTCSERRLGVCTLWATKCHATDCLRDSLLHVIEHLPG